MAAPHEQALADQRENDAARSYLRERRLATVVAEAIRRADAMSRLDASLRSGGRRHPA